MPEIPTCSAATHLSKIKKYKGQNTSTTKYVPNWQVQNCYKVSLLYLSDNIFQA